MVHAGGVQGVLPGFRCLLVLDDSARCRRLRPHGPAGDGGGAGLSGTRPLPAGYPGLCRFPADGGGLRASGTDVRAVHEQPAPEYRVGEAGHPLVQRDTTERVALCRDDAVRPDDGGGSGTGALPPVLPRVGGTRHHHGHPDHPVLWQPQPVRRGTAWRVHRPDLHRGEGASPVYPPGNRDPWRGTAGGRPDAMTVGMWP